MASSSSPTSGQALKAQLQETHSHLFSAALNTTLKVDTKKRKSLESLTARQFLQGPILQGCPYHLTLQEKLTVIKVLEWAIDGTRYLLNPDLGLNKRNSGQLKSGKALIVEILKVEYTQILPNQKTVTGKITFQNGSSPPFIEKSARIAATQQISSPKNAKADRAEAFRQEELRYLEQLSLDEEGGESSGTSSSSSADAAN